jgi:hypothetical protein
MGPHKSFPTAGPGKGGIFWVVIALVSLSLNLLFSLTTFKSGMFSIETADQKPKRTILDFPLDPISDLAQSITTASPELGKGCGIMQYGQGYGEHRLCEVKPKQMPCYFYSFGIENDYTFDVDLVAKAGCFGFAADPTAVNHTSMLKGAYNKVMFSVMSAKSYREEDNKRWMFVTSAPGVRRWGRVLTWRGS